MKNQRLRRVLVRAVNILFRLQQALVCVCLLSLVLGFFFGLGRQFPSLRPVLENTALYSMLLLAPLELLFALAALVKLLAKIEEVSWGLLLAALLSPVAAYFAACVSYGAAHF